MVRLYRSSEHFSDTEEAPRKRREVFPIDVVLGNPDYYQVTISI